ncbi:DNA-binding transcriptional regulator LysR [compost metagenome]
MVKEGVGLSIVNPLTALDYANSGVHVRPFSVEVPFTVSLIRPLHRPSSALVTAFIQHMQQQAEALPARLAAVIKR